MFDSLRNILKKAVASEKQTSKVEVPSPYKRTVAPWINVAPLVWYKEREQPHRLAIYKGTVMSFQDYRLEHEHHTVRMHYDEDHMYIACGNLKANEGDVILYHPESQTFLLMELPEFRHKWSNIDVRDPQAVHGGPSQT